MAIGMGKMLWLHYLENFNYPYIAKSATEFWRRWHISLGTFFRDYVYIPLGGNRKGTARRILNTFIVWALTGLWHGASWNFVLWGLYFFVLIILEKPILNRSSGKRRNLLRGIGARFYFILITMLGWVLFKYSELEYIPVVLKGLVGANGNSLLDFEAKTLFMNNMYLLAFCMVAVTPLFHRIRTGIQEFCGRVRVFNPLFNLIVYGVLPVIFVVISTSQLVSASFNPFLYFRF